MCESGKSCFVISHIEKRVYKKAFRDDVRSPFQNHILKLYYNYGNQHFRFSTGNADTPNFL